VRPDKAGALATRLHKQPGFADLRAPAHRASGNALSDNASVAHLYLAARMGHLFADLIPMPYRVPQAVCQKLADALDARTRATAVWIGGDSASAFAHYLTYGP
jgi:hypothetical protein